MAADRLRDEQGSLLVEKRLRWAGVLIALGLVVQLLTFIRIHPFSFIVFAVIGCPLVLAGVLFYLYSIVSHQTSQLEPGNNGSTRQET